MRPRKRKKRKLTKSEQMARVRNKDTEPEMVLRKALWKSGLRYRLRPGLPGTPDLAFFGRKVAIFVDGCFWHGCPEHYSCPVRNAAFWSRKIERNLCRDRKANQNLADLGWDVIRIWEHEIPQDLDSVVRRIRHMVQDERMKNTSAPVVEQGN